MTGTQITEAFASALAEFGKKGPYLTVAQFEDKHPATKRRMRGWIMRADLNFPDFAGLSDAIVRVGRSVLVDEAAAINWLESRKHQPKSPSRNPHGCVGKDGKKRRGAR